MKNLNKILIISSIVVLISCVKDSGYKEEKLLFRYIHDNQNSIFSEYDEYNLVLYTKDNSCGCHKTPYELDVIIETIGRNFDIPTIIITDTAETSLMNKNTEHLISKIIFEDNHTLSKYSLSFSYVHWFFIKDNRIVKWRKLETRNDLNYIKH